MHKKKKDDQSKTRKLRCPVCQGVITHTAHVRTFGQGGERLLRSQPGELAECSQCFSMLEYIETSSQLSLRPAPQRRIDDFKNAIEATPPEPSISQVIEHVRKHRQMPGRSSISSRFRNTDKS